MFFKKMGIENLRFKPAYNPYTEVGDLGFLASMCLVFGLTISGGWCLLAGYYVPLLQPSLEIFAFHPQLKKWVEVGNSGMFRPEMLEPMGFPKGVNVHGWGIGLERPTMIRYVLLPMSRLTSFDGDSDLVLVHSYGINNIRTLVGHKISLDGVVKSPAVRF